MFLSETVLSRFIPFQDFTTQDYSSLFPKTDPKLTRLWVWGLYQEGGSPTEENPKRKP